MTESCIGIDATKEGSSVSRQPVRTGCGLGISCDNPKSISFPEEATWSGASERVGSMVSRSLPVAFHCHSFLLVF